MNIMTILADSNCLVRPEDNILEKDLYPYKIQKLSTQPLYISNKAKKNNTSELENSNEAFIYHQKASYSSYIIIALGIVDCSPRIFTKRTKIFIECILRIPILKKLASAYIKIKSSNRYSLTKKNRFTEVAIDAYETNIREIIDKLNTNNPIKDIFIINIAMAGENLLKRSYEIEKNIHEYNKVLSKIARENNISIIDVHTYTHKNPHYILSDGHHISVEVHDFIAREIASNLEASNNL